MLFSPASTTPTGYYESGGLNVAASDKDPIAKDCTLLLTVACLDTGEMLMTGKAVAMGSKIELTRGSYRAVAQLLSFNGNVFATAEALYRVLDSYDQREEGSFVPSSAIYDSLANVSRGNGIPAPQAHSIGQKDTSHHQSTSISGSSTPAVEPLGQHPQGSLADTLRQSEEYIANAIEAAGKLTRQGSLSHSTVTPNVPQGASQERPPLPQSSKHHSALNEKGPEDSGTSAGYRDDSAAAPPREAKMHRWFVVPPPSVVSAGVPFSFAVASEVGEGNAKLNVLVQREGVPMGSVPCLISVTGERARIPLPARGIQLRWEKSGESGDLVVDSRSRGLSLIAKSIKQQRGGQRQGPSNPLLAAGVSVSVECFGLTSDDAVLSGIQFAVPLCTIDSSRGLAELGDQVHTYVSLRPVSSFASDAGDRRYVEALCQELPYLELVAMVVEENSDPDEAGSLWSMGRRQGVSPSIILSVVMMLRVRQGNTTSTLTEIRLSANDTVALFCQSSTGETRAAPSLNCVVQVNHQTVHVVPIRVELLPLTTELLQAVIMAKFIAPSSNVASVYIPVLRNITPLSHHVKEAMLVKNCVLPLDDRHGIAAGAANGKLVMYVWEQEESLRSAAAMDIMIANATLFEK